jgi:hypothetical protein
MFFWNMSMVDAFLYKNEYRIFKSVGITIRKRLRQKGNKWRDEPI